MSPPLPDLPQPDDEGKIHGKWRDVFSGVRVKGVVDTRNGWAEFHLETAGVVQIIGTAEMSAGFGHLQAALRQTTDAARRALQLRQDEAVPRPPAPSVGTLLEGQSTLYEEPKS